MRYWLLKTEPDAFSIDDLKRDGFTSWEGVRNYQARNFLRAMKSGDRVLIHHSSIAEPAVVGVGEIQGEATPDPTQFDKKSQYFDAASKKDTPRWTTRKVVYKGIFKVPVKLSFIKLHPELKGMLLAQQGSRLSVQPVEKSHFDLIVKLGKG
ncbi:EVE domain-containing protein [Candidatus Parcubacteria bacterium]|nr:EVE domain-containing protein [Candidatus Parcubacteria bacterium]